MYVLRFSRIRHFLIFVRAKCQNALYHGHNERIQVVVKAYYYLIRIGHRV